MQQPVHIRNYRPEDKDYLVALLRLNIPIFFAESEIRDLEHYLNYEIERYFVAELDGHIIGAGGINFADEGKTAKISWDFIHPDLQRMGVGAQLLQHRLALIKSLQTVESIAVRTSQHAYKFYKKNGFVLTDIKKNYWAPGFDMYHMIYAGE